MADVKKSKSKKIFIDVEEVVTVRKEIELISSNTRQIYKELDGKAVICGLTTDGDYSTFIVFNPKANHVYILDKFKTEE